MKASPRHCLCASFRGRQLRAAIAVCAVVLIAACATAPAQRELGSRRGAQSAPAGPWPTVDAALEERILALDSEHISDADVRKTLGLGPTPRIILLHGGVYPAFLMMSSFASFLEGMGYPENRLRDPHDQAYSQSPYGSSRRLAGEVAWYYENDGLRPMLIGQSLGGMQAVKVLYELQGAFSGKLAVWNPYTDREEDRDAIVDPLTGSERTVVGLSVSFASAVGAGGAAFIVPNQWAMLNRLRTIPDTVDEFVGFSIPGDMVALNFPDMQGGRYRRNGAATVRNVMLPLGYDHITVPITHSLTRDARTRAWINAYTPDPTGEPRQPDWLGGGNAVWAAEVWFAIKKHWCLEAQQFVRALRATASAK